MRTALIYASVDGQTKKISDHLKKVLQKNQQDIEMYSIDQFHEDVLKFDRIIIGSSIRYGIHHKDIIAFIEEQKKKLAKIKTAFFSVNLVARKPEKKSAETNPYVIKYFKSTDWRPDQVDVFAGMLDYKKYTFFDRIMIQFIMWMTKGPTNPETKIEYTNWDDVDQFGQKLCNL
ncbi:menaquinone-dependent protoporphyrinogen IX dehydrogenase [Namhaeicola litoreus]|uniref:Protoporphyrinogen IX dehydrogenase [quinone] n=1 Tax=Namhaeicola litoreus TaxID=1052145 RepID=A0ABW3XY05_9FLAO